MRAANAWWPSEEHGFRLAYQARFDDADHALYRAMVRLGLETRIRDGWVEATAEQAIAVLDSLRG